MKYFIVFFVLLSARATAQTPQLYNQTTNEVQVIHSRLLKQDRRLYIHVPKLDSADRNKTLPVLYLLDGENHFHIVSAYIEYLRHWKVIPPMLIVGIVSVDRVKDLTPIHSLINFSGQIDSNYKTSGGNEQFLDFVEKELMPYVAANYKTSGYNLFAGHSFGGLTAINCLLTRPALFNAYIAISPSFWFGNQSVLQLAAKRLPKLVLKDKKLFYSVGNEGGTFRPDVLKFDQLVKQQGLQTIEHQFTSYPVEDHMTEPIPAYYDALRFIYKNWKPDPSK